MCRHYHGQQTQAFPGKRCPAFLQIGRYASMERERGCQDRHCCYGSLSRAMVWEWWHKKAGHIDTSLPKSPNFSRRNVRHLPRRVGGDLHVGGPQAGLSLQRIAFAPSFWGIKTCSCVAYVKATTPRPLAMEYSTDCLGCSVQQNVGGFVLTVTRVFQYGTRYRTVAS